MYVTASNDAYALNAQTGQILWHYSRPVSQGLIDDASGHINRGVALLGTRLYMETDNAHLLCLDARSGNLIWDVAYAGWNKNYGATRGICCSGTPCLLVRFYFCHSERSEEFLFGFAPRAERFFGKRRLRMTNQNLTTTTQMRSANAAR